MIVQAFFLILSFSLSLVGSVMLLGAKSAIHEIESFILFLIAAVLLGSCAVVGAVDKMRKEWIRAREQLQSASVG